MIQINQAFGNGLSLPRIGEAYTWPAVKMAYTGHLREQFWAWCFRITGLPYREGKLFCRHVKCYSEASAKYGCKVICRF